jgi:hypothetical protein
MEGNLKLEETGPRAPKSDMPLPRIPSLTASKFTPHDLKGWKEFNAMTRRQFADALGINEMTLRRWLSGKVPIPQWLQDGRETAFRR